MKKIIVLALFAVATVANSFALELHEYKVFYKLNNERVFNSLVKYLEASTDQKDQLKNVFLMTENKMEMAINSENENAAEKAMWFNLANAKYILSTEQYKKYLIAINTSVNSTKTQLLAEN